MQAEQMLLLNKGFVVYLKHIVRCAVCMSKKYGCVCWMNLLARVLAIC